MRIKKILLRNNKNETPEKIVGKSKCEEEPGNPGRLGLVLARVHHPVVAFPLPTKLQHQMMMTRMTMMMVVMIDPDCGGIEFLPKTFNMILSGRKEVTLRGALVNWSGLPPPPPSSLGTNLLEIIPEIVHV